MLSIKLLGDAFSFEEFASSSKKNTSTSNNASLSYCLFTNFCTNNHHNNQRFPLALINCGHGVVQSLLNSSRMLLPSTVFLTGSSSFETAELTGLIEVIASRYSKKKHISLVTNEKGDENTKEADSSLSMEFLLGGEEAAVATRKNIKLSIVCSSRKICAKVMKRLEIDFVEDEDDDQRMNTVRKFVKNHVALFTLVGEDDEENEVRLNKKDDHIFQSVETCNEFKLTNLMTASSLNSSSLVFSLASKEKKKTLLSIPTTGVDSVFDAKLLATELSLTLTVFRVVLIPSDEYYNHFTEFVKKQENNISTRFLLVGKVHQTSLPNSLVLQADSGEEVALLGKLTATNLHVQEKEEEHDHNIKETEEREQEGKKITITESPQTTPVRTRRPSVNSQPKKQISPSLSPSSKVAMKMKSPPISATSSSSISKLKSKKVTNENADKQKVTSKQQHEQQESHHQNSSLPAPSSALLLPPSANTTTTQSIPQTPDVSMLMNAAAAPIPSSATTTPTKEKKHVKVIVDNDDAQKNENNTSNENLEQVLKEIGESPAVVNRSLATKSTQTPPRQRAKKKEYDDDFSVSPSAGRRSKSSETSRTIIKSPSSAKEQPKRAVSVNTSRITSSSSTRQNITSSSTSSHKNTRNTENIDFFFSTEKKQPSWRELLEQERSQMIDAPTKLGNACRIYAFSNEDKGLPGKMIMLRSVRTVEQLKQRISELCEIKPVGELLFADTGEGIKSMKDLRGVGEELVATLHGGLKYDLKDPPRLMKCYEQLVPEAEWASLCRNL